MLNELLKPEVKAFIKKHENIDSMDIGLNRLLLNKYKYPEIPIDIVVNQIRARAKAKNKHALWYRTEDVIMPPILSMEQSSSEAAALYKSKFFKGDLAIDLTGGAGVDAFFLSKQFKKVIYIDHNKDLSDIAKHNFTILRAPNIEVIHANSEAFIDDFVGHIDLIYIDPARRKQTRKLFLLEDCSPNIVSLQKQLLLKADIIMIKASPMLDITRGLNQLKNVTEVHVVAIKNEVKELLFIQKRDVSTSTKIVAVDLDLNNPYQFDWKTKERAILGDVSTYLYEPNTAILKSGKADSLALKLNLYKLNTNTHLFTSDKLKKDFPGRIFKVNQVLKYNKKEIRKKMPILKANISTRNFPDTVDEIRKKIGINPGGSLYLFAIRDIENKAKILLCSKF